MQNEIIPLGNIIRTLTDYHANGSYEKLKENVTLKKSKDHAIMIRTTNFEQDDFEDDLIYIDEHAYNYLSKSKVLSGDLIMNKIANAGTCYFMPSLNTPASLGMNLFLIRLDSEKANSYYVYSYLKLKEHYVKSFASGSTTKTITKNDVKKIQIYLPSLPEQNKITEMLSTWDKAITTTEKLLSNSEQQKKALMQQLLTGKKRFPGFGEKWEHTKLKSLAKISKGHQLNRNTLTKTGTYPVINGGITPSGYCETANWSGNSITISEGGNSCGYVSYQKNDFWCGGHCYALSDLKLPIQLTYQLLKFNESKIMRLRVGSGLPNIQKKDLDNLIAYFPTNSMEQKKIASLLSSRDQEIEILQQKLDCLRQEKKALMQQLLTGKRRVTI